MTKPRDPDALLAAYLADGMEVLPDRVVDAVLDEVHRTHQRAVFGPWRTRSMFKIALGAAAVFAVLVLGGTFFLFQRGQPAVVGGPSQTPAIASPTPGASASSAGLSSPSGVPSPSIVSPRAASWTATGSMITPRSDHTATLLRDGKVLVAGGSTYVGSADPMASAELYDPRSGTWTATGSMVTPRSGHTATLLPDGRVLVAGGSTDDGSAVPVASAELYDPGSGTWTATGSMGTPRSGHTATLLNDGKVLVVGGAGVRIINDSAEVYDPVTGIWTAAGSMSTPRYTHAAALLPDGKVLVAGGADSPAPSVSSLLDSAELYDPGSGTWSTTGTMVTIYNNQAAAVLADGKVLAGGYPPELYDPLAASWTAIGSKVISGWYGPAVLLADGRVFVLGAGVPGLDVATGTAAAIFDPVTGSWTAAGKLDRPRTNFTYTATLLLSGGVLVVGGSEASPTTGYEVSMASAELYDPGSGQ
jgi:Kelch motif.